VGKASFWGPLLHFRGAWAVRLPSLGGLLLSILLAACASNRDQVMTSIRWGTEEDAKQWLRTHDVEDIDGVPKRAYEPGLFGGDWYNDSTVLLAAIERGWVEVAKALLDKGASPNAANARGMTPLMAAASGDRESMVKLLVDRGADVNARDQTGHTALMLSVCPTSRGRDADTQAVVKSRILEQLLHTSNPVAAALAEALAKEFHLEVTRDSRGGVVFNSDQVADFMAGTTNLLIKRGAALDARAKDGETALFQAVQCRQGFRVFLLQRRGANVNIANAEGKTPLLAAIEGHTPDLAVLLVEAGADVGRTDRAGYSPVRAGLGLIDDVCCRGCSSFQEMTRGERLGFDRVQCRKSVELLRALYSKGAADREGHGVLWTAHAPCEDFDLPSEDIYQIARLSLLSGADPNAKSPFFETAAMFSFVHSHARKVCHSADPEQDLAMVQLLLDKGADVNVTYSGRDSYFRADESILHFALRERDWKVALLLLHKGAKVSAGPFPTQAPAAITGQARICTEPTMLHERSCEEFRQVLELLPAATAK
jgi:ankyrin repeat protein